LQFGFCDVFGEELLLWLLLEFLKMGEFGLYSEEFLGEGGDCEGEGGGGFLGLL
jgi:hypothetical protein